MLKDNFKNISPAIVLIPIVLTLIGFLFIYSSGINPDGSNSGLFLRQILWIAIGITLGIIVINVDYYRLVETSLVYYLAGVVLLIVPLIFSKPIRGSRSWIGFAGLGIQPSEFMKIFYILFFAKYLSGAQIVEKKEKVFLFSLGILALPLALVMLQPDLGTAIVYIAIFLSMSYIGMSDDIYVRYIIFIGLLTAAIIVSVAFYKYYLEGGGASIELIEAIFNFNTLIIIGGIAFGYAVIAFIIEFFNPIAIISKILPIALIIGVSFSVSAVALKVLKPYQWKRLLVMISPEFDKAGAGYNIIQSKIAIGSGGFFGKGLFRGTQNKLGFLPEKNTDFIFSIIGEELGFFGSSLVIALFLIYFFYIVRTIQNAKDKEGMLVAVGILAMFGIHFIINIGMTVGVTPVTGLPLPFISYGGSSYMAFMVASALILSIYSRRFIH